MVTNHQIFLGNLWQSSIIFGKLLIFLENFRKYLSRGVGVPPIMAYTGRLCPKGVPFSGFRYIKGREIGHLGI